MIGLTKVGAASRCGRVCLAAFGLSLALPAWSVTVDGRVDSKEWEGAQYVTDFRKNQPLNGEPGSLKTEAWILSTPEGLAVAFKNWQPPEVPRTRQRVQRDFADQVDRINVMVDFDNDRRTGYDITISSTDGIFDAVITNENEFKADWDGNFKHAVSEDNEAWYVEVLIPWHIASMREVKSATRVVGLYLDRVIGTTGERSAWPLASFERPRFLSDFSQVTLTNHSQSLLAITPYVSGLYDNVDKFGKGDAGVDIFWKPNGQFQLTATANPDFGQVESDDLVVNFDATETFISDKRPFFTENQGIFEFTTPSDFSQLLYTRRIGGPADDGKGSGDITGALKLNGSFGSTKYGLFTADEAEDAGRFFAAARVVRDFQKQNIGLMVTRVDRPFLDREAITAGIDHNWRPTNRWNIRTRFLASDIDQNGERTRDTGTTLWADYEMDHGWRQQVIAMHFGNDLQINDAGYLSRNSLNYAHWQVNKRFAALPTDSLYSSKEWRWRYGATYNDHGQLLNHVARATRQSTMRNGSTEFAQININSARVNDLIMRGNGFINLPPNFNSVYSLDRPRKGNWAYKLDVELYTAGLAGNHLLDHYIEFTPTYFLSDAFNLYAGAGFNRNRDWLNWQQGNLISTFDQHETFVNAGFNWTISRHQELRLRLQAIGITADLKQPYRVDPNGNAIASNDPVEDFNAQSLAFQIRYRYELAPLSYLYIVYGRGGFSQAAISDNPTAALGDSFSLRDDEQLLIKLSYRFER